MRNYLTHQVLAEQARDEAAKLVADHPVRAGKKLVLMYAGGGILPERAWPAEHYARVAQGLCAAGFAVGLIGLKDDAQLAKDLMAQIKSDACIDLTGYTRSIRELLMLFHASSLLITNDGGPGHFATLTPIQTMVFFGPETGKLYGPLGTRNTILESGIACSPCLSAYNHRLTFCDGDNQCLQQIDVAQVLRLTQTQLALAASLEVELPDRGATLFDLKPFLGDVGSRSDCHVKLGAIGAEHQVAHPVIARRRQIHDLARVARDRGFAQLVIEHDHCIVIADIKPVVGPGEARG